MLQSLFIKNIALIQECKLELGNGLNILSGETGAGKSIIIDSFSFVLGAKADKSLIRFGESKASVEAVFTVESQGTYEAMAELGIEQESTLIIYRAMTDNRNEIRVNGQAVTLSMLKRLTSTMVDILGQHEHHSLMLASAQLKLLDNYAGAEVSDSLHKIESLLQDFRSIKSKLSAYGDERERERKLDILSYQIKEIDKAALKEGEEEELLAARERFRNGEKIINGVMGAYKGLDGEELSVLSMLSDSLSSLSSVSRYDKQLAELYDRAESAKIELKDIAETLMSFGESFDYDESTAQKIEKRVDTIRTLKRKYGATVEDILSLLNTSKEEYDVLVNADNEISKLNKKLFSVKEELFACASKLSDYRRKAAKALEKAVIKELSQLAMSNTMFQISFAPKPSLEDFDKVIGSTGFDDICFNISPNLGEPMRPLSKIASGGEMSRFMLAMKNITSELDGVSTMVFDEIDTGISGNVAFVVAQKMYNISNNKQVIAVTHLPQLASYADMQYLISKAVVGEKTVTKVVALDTSARINELVRLTGGKEGSEAGINHAKELLSNAARYKVEL